MSRSSTSEVLRAHCEAIAQEELVLREGGGKAGHERQRKMGRLSVRERLRHLLDKDSPFFEIGLWAGYKMYEQWGKIPAAGVVIGIGNVQGIPCMIIANDATVKAGAFFPRRQKRSFARNGSPSSARCRSSTLLIRRACSFRCRMKFFR